MENRIGVIGIVITDNNHIDRVNETLHMHSDLIIGRLGIPYKEKNVSVISLIVDGTSDDISSLTGKLGKIPFVQVKSALTKV